MNFEIENRDSGAILHLEGKIIGDGAIQLRHVLEEQIESDIKWLILDLAEVPLMDSSAIGTMIMAFLRLKENGGKLVLLYAQKSIHEVLSITKLNTLFEVYDNLQNALQSVKSI